MKYFLMTLFFFSSFCFADTMEIRIPNEARGKGIEYTQVVEGVVISVGTPLYAKNESNCISQKSTIAGEANACVEGYGYTADYNGIQIRGILSHKPHIGEKVQIIVTAVFWLAE